MAKLSTMICAVMMSAALTGSLAAQQTTPPAATQAQAIKRTPLQRFEVPGTGYETIIGIAEIAPSMNVGRHTHPGPESGYVIAGSFELLIDGEPARLLGAGDSYMVPATVVHDARTGPDGAKVIATYLIPQGQPIATPAN